MTSDVKRYDKYELLRASPTDEFVSADDYDAQREELEDARSTALHIESTLEYSAAAMTEWRRKHDALQARFILQFDELLSEQAKAEQAESERARLMEIFARLVSSWRDRPRLDETQAQWMRQKTYEQCANELEDAAIQARTTQGD